MDARVWDKFLTEQDKELAARHPVRPRGLGERPALLLIDLYRGVFGERDEPVLEAVESWPNSCGHAGWEALPHIVRLLTGARRHRLPVIHVTGQPGIPGWRDPRGGARRSAAELEAFYTLMPQVAPLEDEILVRKAAPSAFHGTELDGILRQFGVDAVIVAGESTSGCVRATVVDGTSLRFKMTVAEECVFDRTEASHAVSLFDLSQKYADVRPVDEVLCQLGLSAPVSAE